MTKQLALPPFYNPKHAAEWTYRANHRNLVLLSEKWRGDHGIKASTTDPVHVTLLIIDGQKDFLFPPEFDASGAQVGGGTLYVGGRSGRGAIDDSARTAEFIYRNLAQITDIQVTLDTHFAFQIFSPAMMLDADGKHPMPFTFVVARKEHVQPWMASVLVVNKGEVRFNPAVAGWLANGNYGFMQKQLAFYCEQLHASGRYDLILWPEHCMLGDDGHALAGILQEARMFHGYVRGMQTRAEVKGGNAWTENYSVLGPEVTSFHNGTSCGQKNPRFVKTLLDADRVVIAGQAGSHCVASSTDDLLQEIKVQDPALAEKVYVLTDCMSAVTVPDGKGGFLADFTPQMEDAFTRWGNAGMKLVKSTDPIDTWPGFYN